MVLIVIAKLNFIFSRMSQKARVELSHNSNLKLKKNTNLDSSRENLSWHQSRYHLILEEVKFKVSSVYLSSYSKADINYIRNEKTNSLHIEYIK